MNREIKAFNDYVKNYDMNNKRIKLKYVHTFKVIKNCELIAKSLNLNEEEIYLCKLIGLLHDIGRFEQVKKYNSMKDINMDHAQYGIKILFEDNLIRNFINDNKYDDIIYFAIKNHNKLKIENTSDEYKLMFAKIIRDADKIDIFRVLYTENILLFDSMPSKKILDDFYNERSINNLDIKNNSDSIISRFCFLYDINYNISYKLIKEYKYMDKFIDKIEVNDKFSEIFNNIINIVYKYLDKKVEI